MELKQKKKAPEQLVSTPEIIGEAPAMQEVFRVLGRVSQLDVTVLINGETGTGKEVIASALHQFSRRKAKPFVAINCGGMTESIIESELFGHEAGSFTSANKKRIGKIEQANGGTLFLDEIESMPITVQIKLLRVIQERMIERVGGNELIPVDIVVVAASKADLASLSETGEFRADLFYRLNIASLNLPALRQRKEDIQVLFRHFVIQASQKYRTRPSTIYPEQIQHQWIALTSINEAMPLAVVAAEDQRFLSHYGVDFLAIWKAYKSNQQGGRLRGGSTITQQTAKNLWLWPSQSYWRKAVEAGFAVLLELNLSKARIIELYLNIAEFGPGIYGVEAASQHYFALPSSQLNANQAASLAALLPSPYRYSLRPQSAFMSQRISWIRQQMRQLGPLELNRR